MYELMSIINKLSGIGSTYKLVQALAASSIQALSMSMVAPSTQTLEAVKAQLLYIGKFCC